MTEYLLLAPPTCIICGGIFVIVARVATCQGCGVQFDLDYEDTEES